MKNVIFYLLLYQSYHMTLKELKYSSLKEVQRPDLHRKEKKVMWVWNNVEDDSFSF